LPELTRTREGWEMQFATNFVGHFALTVGLYDALAAASGARTVSLSSTAHLSSPVILDDLHFRFRSYDPRAAYAQSRPPRLSSRLRRPDAGRQRVSTPLAQSGCHRDGVAAARGLVTPVEFQRPCRKGRQPRCCWQPHRCSTGSADGTSRTATNLRWWQSVQLTSAAGSRPTPSTRRTPRGCGEYRRSCSSSS
jgi:hypothetical protein